MRGMTCDHSVVAVTEEISALTGVIGVDVDLVVNGNSRVIVATSHTRDVNLVRVEGDALGNELNH